MAFSLTLVVILILKLCLAALAEQQIKFAIQPNPVQCADENLQWTGGIPPFVVTIGTTSDANVSSATVAPNVQGQNYTWSPVDIPGGTPITIGVRSSAGDSVETNTINVQSSSNSSCLDDGEVSPPPTAHTGHSSNVGATASQTPAETTSSSSTSATGTSFNSKSSSNSHVAIIAGVVVGCLVLLAVIVVLMMMQRRRDRRRNQMSSKQALVQTFGSAKADLDSAGDDDAESMAAVPEPYVYGAVSRSRSNLAIETEDLSRRPSSVRTPNPAGPARSPGAARRSPHDSARSPATPATRKGERYLPNHANSPQEFSPGGASSGRSGIQEEDIDRLAARMVAMMSSGRISEQAWTPGGGRGPQHGAVDDDDALSPPPMYKDVARSGGRPRE